MAAPYLALPAGATWWGCEPHRAWIRLQPLREEPFMSSFDHQETLDALLARLQQVGWKEREQVKDELLDAARAAPDRTVVIEHLTAALKGLSLELRWEVEEVLEALAPEPEPEPEPEVDEPEPPADDGQLRMSDLQVVYDDPRGLMVYKHKTQDRWFAVQPDPRTGQPQMFELHATEVQQLKTQLKGSPYWVLGAG